MIGPGGSAHADQLSDNYGDYPADFVDVLPELEKLGLPTEPVWPETDGSESFNPLAEGCPPSYESGNEPDAPDITFKTFRRSPLGPSIPIKIDQWDPALPPVTSAPAVVLFHGGGWRQGCRRLLQTQARELAEHGHIVFSSDYRLACQPSDDPTEDEESLCGWQYPTTDVETGTPGAALHDVADAVGWVRAHAGDYWTGFNGKVAAAGGSAGGNLLYRATGPLAATDTRRPVVVSGWSGNAHFAEMSNDDLLCDDALPGQSAKDDCWAAVIRYLGCDIRTGPRPGACESNYYAAEPNRAYTSTGPPAFIINGTEELVPALTAEDLYSRLRVELNLDAELCEVEGDSHGRGLLGHPCIDSQDQHSFDTMIAFFDPYVTQ